MTEHEIQLKKKSAAFFRAAEIKAKGKHCAICGSEETSFSNSHSVPRFVLKNIAVQGKLKIFGDIVGRYNSRDGINNSWTFHIICSTCEHEYFSVYENETALLELPSNKVMASIALKNALFMLSKYRIDGEVNEASTKAGFFVGETDILPIVNKLDKRDMAFEIKRSKKIIEKNLKSGYSLVYYNVLNWRAPIAFQSAMCLPRDIAGNEINDIFDESEKTRVQQLHVAVFPLTQATVVMMFHHRDDRNYISFDRQFSKFSDDEKLQYINYLIFRYTEHALLSPRLDPDVFNDEKLVALCEENDYLPFPLAKSVLVTEIPNFLSEKFALIDSNM